MQISKNMDRELLSLALKQEVAKIFQQYHQENLLYHNQLHTEMVVQAALQMAEYYNLSDRDKLIVESAAWFHDLGYLTQPNAHEEAGAKMARTFLSGKGVEEVHIAAVEGCILATKMPQSPRNLLEEIVCDADLHHLGTDDFLQRSKLLRKECEFFFNTKIPKSNWREKNIQLLEKHRFHTDYAQQHFQPVKEKNLKDLREKHLDVTSQNSKTPTQSEEKPSRGIETMFRISSNNHQRLSDMADNKAHIMITTTSIIISVLLSVLLRKLEEYPHLTIPVILLLVVCVTTMVFSILATRPSIPPGVFQEEDIREKKVNLLFFGNFYKMSLQEYAKGMEAVMNDRQFLYGSLVRDVYAQGVVLGKKYKLLRLAYNVFMFGIIISVIAFVAASLLYRWEA